MNTGYGVAPKREPGLIESARAHWPEYLCEAACLGAFMISACVVTAMLEHPASPLNRTIESPFVRRVLIGVAMGATLIAIVFSPMGQRSGAHMNPAFTLNYFLLRKVRGYDAMFYVLAQFIGGALGVGVSALIVGPALRDAAVRFAVTVPGPDGPWVAFTAESIISAIMMLTVLTVSNRRNLARFTPFFAGILVATFITCEAPYSGMSMNPARTVASGSAAGIWTSLWIYLTAPLLGMLIAATLYRYVAVQAVFCAKLHHNNGKRCIFRCNYSALEISET